LGANLESIKLIIERIIPNKQATQKLGTEKPSTIAEQRSINKALMTIVNKPKVKILIGKVKIIKIGLIIKLIKPKTKATTTAVQKPFKITPGKI